MTLCQKIERALGVKAGLYDRNGQFLQGNDVGFKLVEDMEYDGRNTYIRSGFHIISVGSRLSQDTCNLVKLTGDLYFEKEAADFMQSLEYILKNEVTDDIIKGKYSGSSVIYILSKGNIKDILESIYEGYGAEVVDDDEGCYLVKQFDDMEQDGETLKTDLLQEKGLSTIIGAGKIADGNYTIKHSALHAKTASILARNLGFKEGFYHIDKMILYGLIDSVPDNNIDFFIQGGYRRFEDVFKDRELIETAEELFKCHLNISEASRRLYLHRNTLLYRVEKIKNLTGLDIKKFDDAIIFRTIISVYKLKKNK